MTEALETTFSNIKIGRKDSKGLELFNGDLIEIQVAQNVKHIGELVYYNSAFCLKKERDTYGSTGIYQYFPLCNYASYCKITKIK